MELSIIVPTYNVENFLANCLNSLVIQDVSTEKYEIIIVNDGSTDLSGQIALEFAKKYAQIKVFHQENQGLSSARNQGIKLAKGKYILFVDSDDYIAHNTLGYTLSLMTKFDLDVLELGFVKTASLDLIRAANNEIILIDNLEVTDGITFIAKNNYFTSAWGFLIKRDYLVESDLFFPIGRLHEDTNFTASLVACSKRIGKTSLDIYRWVIRPGSITRNWTRNHALRLIESHEKNIYEIEPLLENIGALSHPHAQPCLSRLKSKQYLWVFHLLLVSLRSRLPKSEVEPVINRLKTFGVYPIDKVLLRDNGNLTYTLLRFIMNRKPLLLNFTRLLSLMDKVFPEFQSQVDKLMRSLARLKN